MCRPEAASRRRLVAASSLAGVLAATSAAAAVRFEVAGSLRPAGDRLEVDVTLRNAGDRTASRVSIAGELAGVVDGAAVDDLPPGAERTARLRFPADVPRPGVHAVALTIDYAEDAEAAGRLSQRASLLVAVGAAADPVLRVEVAGARIGSYGTVDVRLESADGAAHRARLRILAPRDLRIDDPEAEIDVPPRGAVRVELRAFRSAAPWDARRGIVALASTVAEGLERTSAAGGTVAVGSPPSLLPRLRVPLVVAAAALLIAAVVVDVRRRLSADHRPGAGA